MFAAVGTLALSTLSAPASGAVTMLRTGVDPEQLEPEADVEEVGYRRRRRRWRRRRGPRVGIRIWI
jgi:hypothetical protein